MEVINRQLAAEFPSANEDRVIRMAPLVAQIHGQAVPLMLAILSGAVLLVLLIACANAANLLLARGAVRRREIALRTALGAGKGRILRQLVTESILLSSLAGVLGLAFAAWSIRALVSLAPQGIARLEEARIDMPVLAFSFGLSLATGLLFGLAPAIRMSQEIGNWRQTSGTDARAMRRVFVVAQVALSVVLLTGAGLLIRSFVAVQSVDPGFHLPRGRCDTAVPQLASARSACGTLSGSDDSARPNSGCDRGRGDQHDVLHGSRREVRAARGGRAAAGIAGPVDTDDMVEHPGITLKRSGCPC